MTHKLRFLLPLAAILTALGVATAQAATSATQNLTFSVPAVVSIASNGNVSAGSLTGSTTVTGSFTIGSNDPSGFSLTYSTPAATVTESGCGSPSRSLAVGHITAQAGAVTGGTGAGGTPAATNSLSTTPTNAYTTNPLATGSGMLMTASYVIDATNIPVNTTGCSYIVPTVWVIAAL